MFTRKRAMVYLSVLLLSVTLAGCTKKWKDHDQITDSALYDNLQVSISKTTGLAKFNELLVKSGYDKVINSSRTYTVWAPTDQALQTLDASILSDTVKLKLFVANHISNQSYLSLTGTADQRIRMLNGKYIIMSGNKFDSANITTANRYANNGVFHIIDKFIPRTENNWEFLNSTSAAPLMKSFLLSLNHPYFDPATAKQIGVNPSTGLPIYDTASGTSIRNYFLDSVMNVSDEVNQYTLILLTNAAYTTEFNKLTPWFKTNTTDSTSNLTASWLIRDLAFKGLYTAAQLPDTLVSQYGVKVPINKSAILASYKTSNGIVHIMNQVNFTLAYKFPPVIIEGERPTSFSADRSANTFYRIRYDSMVKKAVFRDILLQNYNVASYSINYLVKNLNSMRYNAYWVAVNDVQTTPLWQQRLAIDSTTTLTNLPYVTVAYKNYNEVSLGTVSLSRYRNLNLFVVGPGTASSSGGVNSISLDYIKLVPAF